MTTTFFIVVLFTKITEQDLSTANTTLGITHRFVDQLGAHFAFAKRLITHQVFQLGHILMRVIENAFSFHAIATTATSLLVIILNRLGDIIMYHKTDVRFIDPHSKSNGGNDHINIFI